MNIDQRLKALEQSSNIIPSCDQRVLPNAMTLAFHAETRIGYWWYHPESECYTLLSKDDLGYDSGLLEEICSEDEASTEEEAQMIHKNMK